jgi:hypothetical protein
MTIATLLNSAWLMQCRAEALRYERAFDDVEGTQSAVLRQCLMRNAESEFGREYGFTRIHSARQFQRQIPLCSYESLGTWINRIADGQKGVLTRERVLMFEPTSGSSGPEKLIPYTRSLKRQFQRAISAWAWNTFSNRPALRDGSSYWSFSPAFGPRRTTPGGLPIGFEDDTQYLSLPQRIASLWTLAVDPSVARLESIDNFRYLTLLQLVRASNLAMISIWSPTFLTALLAKLDDWWPVICHDLARGTVTWPAPQDEGVKLCRTTRRRRSSARAEYLTQVFRTGASDDEKFSRIWPSLGLISCWTDASAAQYLPALKALFPGVEIQSKGLIATEGIVSIPRVGQTGTALALRSHFFEFQEEQGSDDGQARLAHELEAGGKYRVILTTGGGLYRYQLGDSIQVEGFSKQCPMIRFLGRSGVGCDLVGEKLHERHVRQVIEDVFAAEGIAPSFSLLVPVASEPPRYVLYLQGRGIESTSLLRQTLAKKLEAGLEKNPYYRYAVQLGQLAEAQAIVLDPHGKSAWQIFERVCVAAGQKPGDVKPQALHPGTDWAEALAMAEPGTGFGGGHSPADVRTSGRSSPD